MLTLLLFVTEVPVACNSTSLHLTQTETLQLLHKYYIHIITWVFHFCYLSESLTFPLHIFLQCKARVFKVLPAGQWQPIVTCCASCKHATTCTCTCSSSALHAKLRYDLAQNNTKGTTPFNFNSCILVIKADWIFKTCWAQKYLWSSEFLTINVWTERWHIS